MLEKCASTISVVLFSRDPPKVVRTPKTATFEKYPTNILCKEKHVHRIISLLPKPNKASKTIELVISNLESSVVILKLP